MLITFQAHNEQLLKDLCEKCNNGTFGTLAEAIGELTVPRLKVSRPYSNYKGPLCLGDPNNGPDKAMEIHVERYFKTHKANPPSASNFIKSTILSQDNDGDTNMGGVPPSDGFAAVQNEVTYYINGEHGRQEVRREELAKGYEYGRTPVPISASEENVTKLETKREFTILGFVPEENVSCIPNCHVHTKLTHKSIRNTSP